MPGLFDDIDRHPPGDGTGIPTSPNVHETAAACAAGTRVVYADNDPVIHAHANALLTGTGTTRIILADLRDPEIILAAILHFIPDTEDPAGLVAAYRDALPGSFLKKIGVYAAVAAKD
jgi:S-adenosyl methyltransferase